MVLGEWIKVEMLKYSVLRGRSENMYKAVRKILNCTKFWHILQGWNWYYNFGNEN